MAIIEDDLARAVTEGFRLAQLDIANQDKLLTGPDDVQIELANGQKKKGPSWPKIAKLAEDANLPAFTTIANNVHTDAQQVAGDKTTAGASKDAAKISETNAKTSENNAASSKSAAKTSETNSKTSETNAASSAAQAKIDADRAQLANPDNWESAPYPDVWIPFNDSLKMEAGFGPYDTIKVGTDTINLPSRSATFTRASTATYVDKSGVLQTAAINEPRFEKEGLLIEGQSTNLVLSSESSGSDNKFTFTSNGEWTTFLTAVADSTYNFVSTTPLVGNFVAGDVYTISCWVTENTCTGPLRIRALDAVPSPDNKDYPAGYVGRLVLTFTAGGSNKLTPAVYLNGFGTNPLGTKITIGRWQVEKLPFATSYIKTTGAAATRAADFCTFYSASNFIKQDVTLAFEVKFHPQDTSAVRRRFFTCGQYYTWGFETDGGMFSYFGETAYWNGAKATSFNQKLPFVLRHDATKNIATYYSGRVLGAPGRTPTIKTDALFIFGADNGGGTSLFGHLRNFRIWHRALTDAQLKSLR